MKNDFTVRIEHRKTKVDELSFSSFEHAKKVARSRATGRLTASVLDGNKRVLYRAEGYWR